jgi:hypothetical protein
MGVNSTFTPYCRNVIVTTDPLPLEPGWSMGKGNSPPERKFAVLPLIVVIVGSARI